MNIISILIINDFNNNALSVSFNNTIKICFNTVPQVEYLLQSTWVTYLDLFVILY